MIKNPEPKLVQFLVGEGLLKEFDELAVKHNWADRSEALRGLMRKQIDSWKAGKGDL